MAPNLTLPTFPFSQVASRALVAASLLSSLSHARLSSEGFSEIAVG